MNTLPSAISPLVPPLVLLLTAALLLLSSHANARTVLVQNLSFRQLDANRNGVIERHEAHSRPELSQFLREADLNHDGKLTQREFEAAQANLTRRGRL